ncbi:hypothetical protein HanIR_Chr05g0223981 [Helianthus annuus]|nr:hypothetical protein HanIR_Chr05g0223981 [Helianthus annuus]
MHSIYSYVYLDMTSPSDPPYSQFVRQHSQRPDLAYTNSGLGELNPCIPVDELYHLHLSSSSEAKTLNETSFLSDCVLNFGTKFLSTWG